MSQTRVTSRLAIFAAALLVPAMLLSAETTAETTAETEAQTSFTEPADRPVDSATDAVLAEPSLPEPVVRPPEDSGQADASSQGSSARASGATAGEGMVDGRSVGSLAAPGLPGSAEAQTAPEGDDVAGGDRASIAEPPVSALDPGLPARVGPRPERSPRDADERAPSAAASAPRTPVIDSDPVRPADPLDPAAIAAALRVDERWPEIARRTGGVVADRQVIAYYGHPMSRFMGILGETAIETMSEQLRARAAEYDAINGEIGVAPAFHIIYGTVYEDASVGILREPKLIEYIEYAAENDIIVFLDHQIGNGTVEGAVRRMLPYLRYPHVHLAFDPEWATDRPGKVIGGVHANDINLAQQMMQDYLIENNLPGPRMLVVHQFNWRMIAERELVRADYPMVQLIHHADGFGNPPNKRASWQFNVIAGNMPLKGFKLFYPKSWRDGGYDDPLMTPAEVMQLEPVPVYIQYQ